MSCHLKGLNFQSDKYPTAEHYPFNLPLFRNTGGISFSSKISIFVGENGTGKSTLLQALARSCGIHIWKDSTLASYSGNPYESLLHHYLSVQWVSGAVPGAYFGSEVFNDFRKILDQWAESDPGQLNYFGGESLVTKSHGQSIMAYFRSRYKIRGLFFLDEPETALSPKSQLELLKIIHECSQAGHAQFIIATHSPILLACKDADIYSFDGETLKRITYKETSHYKIYKKFMADPDEMLK